MNYRDYLMDYNIMVLNIENVINFIFLNDCNVIKMVKYEYI